MPPFCTQIAQESISDSPHDEMHCFVEMSWIFSNVVGVLLFLLDMMALAWVKFWSLGAMVSWLGRKTAIASSVVLLVAIGLFGYYAVYFYKNISSHHLLRSKVRIHAVQLQLNDLGERARSRSRSASRRYTSF